MLSLLRPHVAALAVSLLLLGAATAAILMQPLAAGRLVDDAASGGRTVVLGSALVGLLVGQLLLEAWGHFVLDRTGERITRELRAEFTRHVVRLPIGTLDRTRTGDLLARGASDAGLVRDMPRAVGDLAFGVLVLIGAGTFMVSIDAVTVGVVVAVLGATFLAANPFLSRIQRASLNRQAALGDYASGLERTLGAARTVKLFGAEDREAAAIGSSAGEACDAGTRVAAATAINTLLVRLGVTGAFVAIMIIDGARVAAGGLSVGRFVSLLAFAVYAIFPITAAFTALANLRIAAGAHDHLTGMLRELPETREDTAPQRSTRVGPAPPAGDAAPLVEFDHVGFSYRHDAPVLDDVSFVLRDDQVTALVGPSGSGKSTILALLCRFYDPTAGELRWRGQDVARIPLGTLRGRLGLLEQDAPVLHGTVRDNLLIADPSASDDALWRVLEQASVSDEIASLPSGLDTPVLERGRSLSGGQRQRLALARALLSRSELILMDEPTAHLDRANEADVMTNLAHARGDRGVLVVAHRLSTVRSADQILLLAHGRIEASGTHSELLSVPAYRALVDHELARD